MKKLYGEESRVLKTAKIPISSILFFLLFTTLKGQIPVNGFCRYDQFETSAGQSAFAAIDFNSDGWRDLAIWDGIDKNYSVHFGENGQFNKGAVRFLGSPLSAVFPISVENSGRKRFGFVSRKNREVGILLFSKNGSASIQSKIKLDAYPSSIDISDTDKDGRKELLVSGSAYRGISVLKENGRKLTESFRIGERLFASSVFIDLDYDGYPDIAAHDLLSNSIIFFYNDQTGKFRQARSIGSENEISNFAFADLNNDGFNDLVYSTKKGFKVFAGDSVSSFSRAVLISTNEPADSFALFDYNGDGYQDVAFINKSSGNFSIIFAKDSESFHPALVYFRKPGITGMAAYVDRGGRKIALLCADGKIFLVQRIGRLENTLSIPFGIEPGIVGSFDLYNDKQSDFYFIDRSNQKLNLLLSSQDRLFEKFYSFDLRQNYSNAVVDDLHPTVKTFYFYNQGERVIEILRIDFMSGKPSRRIFYSSGPIDDLKIQSDRIKDRQTIYVLSSEKGLLSMESFDFRDFRYVSGGSFPIGENSIAAALVFGVYKEIFFLSHKDDLFRIIKAVFNRKVTETNLLKTIRIGRAGLVNSGIKSFSDTKQPERTVAAWISDGMNASLFVINRNYTDRILFTNFSTSAQLIKMRSYDEDVDLYFFNTKRGTLNRVSYRNNFSRHSIGEFFVSKNLYSYIIAPVLRKKELLLYSESGENSIKVRLMNE